MRYIDIVFDVESDGQYPLKYSMVQLGAVAIIDGEIVSDFMAYLKPRTEFWEEDALKACNLTREITMGYPVHTEGVEAFHEWLRAASKMGYQPRIPPRLQGWSDNPAFDWQFVHQYLMEQFGANPMGHSCRRIGDLASGLLGEVRNHSSWKKLKKTSHTHVAIDDARGNGEALIALLRD